jgi:hypothetical protein
LAALFVPLMVLAGRQRARPKLQLLQSMSSAFRAPCPSDAAAPLKGAVKTEEGVRKGMKG